MPFMIPLMIFYVKNERKSRDKKRRRVIGLQFRDAILSASAGMKAGSSVEHAFVDAGRDMALLHGASSRICEEIQIMAKGLANNLTLEELLWRMAERTDHDDIREFAEVFRIAKRSGGNMTQIINDTAKVISDRIEVEHQIVVITSAKRLEAHLMEVVPLFIILYIGITTPGFFAPLYHNIFGCIFMTVALVIYVFAYLTAERIIEIEV